MRGRTRSLAVCLLTSVALVLLVGSVAAAGAQEQIGPNQHFIGLVNGSNVDPFVYTVCPGPVSAGRTGPVAGGQAMSVAEVAGGHGDTGVFSQIDAWFVPIPKTPAVTTVKFTDYGVPQPIPTSIRVPCDGPGKAEFSSCPYRAPCAYGWVPNFVHVRFVNIAL